MLENEIKLQNALPVAGFLTRSPSTADGGEHQHQYIRSGQFRANPSEIHRVIADIKDEMPSLLSSEPEILSFVVLLPFDDRDAIITWERYASQSALEEVMKNGRGYSKLMEKIGSLVVPENMTEYRIAGGYISRDV